MLMSNLKLISLAILVAVCVYFTWDYVSTKEENKRLTDQIRSANSTIEKADKKLQVENDIRKTTDQILKEVRDAPKDQDGDVAPVLDNAIDRIERLRNSQG